MMPSVRYYIEKRRDEHGRLRTRGLPILVYFSYDGQRLQLNSGERVDLKDWDPDRQQVGKSVRNSRQINTYLHALGEELLRIYQDARVLGIQPGKDYLRDQLKYHRRKQHAGFFEVFMQFIDENHAGWSIHTFRKIRTIYNHLRKFAASEGLSLEFNRLDQHFLEQYIQYFRIRHGHSNTTIAKNIEVLKWFLNWATEKGFNQSLIYREFRLPWASGPRIRQEDLILDWEELMNLYRHDAGDERSEAVRDLFCFMCFTGLKLSRVNQIHTNQVYPGYLQMNSKQGGSAYQMPLNRFAREILEKRMAATGMGENCFPVYRHPVFNRLLKQLGREAGINHFVTLDFYRGQEHGTRTVPKYEILSSRMAVNTFLFNGLKLGISPEVLQFITDHQTNAAVERIRPVLEHAAWDDVQKFDHFQAAPDQSGR